MAVTADDLLFATRLQTLAFDLIESVNLEGANRIGARVLIESARLRGYITDARAMFITRQCDEYVIHGDENEAEPTGELPEGSGG